jgi:hypothetical protein
VRSPLRRGATSRFQAPNMPGRFSVILERHGLSND